MDIEMMVEETRHYLAQAKTEKEIAYWADALARIELIRKGVL